MTQEEQYKQETGQDAVNAIYTIVDSNAGIKYPHKEYNTAYLRWLEKKADQNDLEKKRRVAAEELCAAIMEHIIHDEKIPTVKELPEYEQWKQLVKEMESKG